MRESLKVDYRALSPYVRFVHEVALQPGTYLPERVIYDHEFIYTIRGSGTVRIEDRVHRIGGGDLVHIRPHLANDMTIAGDGPLVCFAVHFDYVNLGESLDFSPYAVYLGRSKIEAEISAKWLPTRPTAELGELAIPERLRVGNVQGFFEVFRQLCAHFESARPDAHLWLKADMLRLIGLIHQELTTKEGIAEGHPHADKVLEAISFMQANYADKITVPSLAKRAMLAPKYFGTVFKEATGQSVADYLLLLRMSHAKKLLRQNRHSVQEVAELVGIGDIYYFSKLFKRVEGMPPKRYMDSMSWLEGGISRG